jgi:predicted permease
MSEWPRIPYVVRGLLRDPVLALTATAILALCIGASTTMFSIVDSILVRPLPYPDSTRIYWISERMKRDREGGVSADYYDLREKNRVFDDVAAFVPLTLNWGGIERPEHLDAAQVSASLFRVLGVRPILGRYLARDEEGSKAPPVVVVSYSFWRNRLGADAGIAGKTILLDGLPNTIIGVMPQGFDFPRGTAIWKPLPLDEASQLPRSVNRMLWQVTMIARLRQRVRPQELEADMDRLTYVIHAAYPSEWRGGLLDLAAIVATPLQRRLTGDLRPALLVLSGAVAMVLLIACVNLAGLLLARASTRQRELAVRLALGSGRGRIVRQMLLESVALSLPGGLAGCGIAWLAVHLLNARKPWLLVNYPPISVDARVLAFAFGLTMITAFAFGMAPAFAAARVGIHDPLKGAGRTHSGGKSVARLRRILVVAELGVSLMLLIGAGLLARSFVKLTRTNLGFPPDHLLTLRVNLAELSYATAARQARFYEDVLARVKQLPMVRSAAVASHIPLQDPYGFVGISRFQIEGRAPLPRSEWPSASTVVVSPEFFHTMEMPIERGRLFDKPCGTGAAKDIVVNTAFVQRIFPGENPVGHRTVSGPHDYGGWTIVGVVSTIQEGALGVETSPMMYSCVSGSADAFLLGGMALFVRTAGDPNAAIRAVEGQVYAVDRNQPVFDVKTMQERLEQSLAPQQFQLMLIGGFAALALALAGAGVYGVMSYLVARRTREIGIRMAMGARTRDVLALAIRESMLLVAVGAGIGLAGAWALTRYVRSMLYGVTAWDGMTFTLAPMVLAAIVLLATAGPARRAAGTDPMTALRED